MTKLPKWLEEYMRKDAHLGLSQLPSENVSTLDFDCLDWPWIDAIYLAEANRDPTQLIALLGQEQVPPAVLPFLTALLRQRLGRKQGRPSILPTRKAINYHFAEKQVRELAAAGSTIVAAAKTVAPQWGLTAKQLTNYCRNNTGYARARR